MSNARDSSIIRLSKSAVGEEEVRAVSAVVQRGYLGMGPVVFEFEELIAKRLGVEKSGVVCVSSGTAALHLALEALDIGIGDEVVVPSITYVASFQAIEATGAVAVPCDCDPYSGLMCLDGLRALVTERTRAVLYVHYASITSGISEVREFCRRKDLRLIEDAAHSFGTDVSALWGEYPPDILCFSFDGIKNITSGEGGCLVCTDPVVISRVSDARLLGVENDSGKRKNMRRSWDFDVSHRGFRYHMSDIMAALGVSQIRKLDAFASERRSREKFYHEAFENCDGLDRVRRHSPHEVPHIYPILVDKSVRDTLRREMLNAGIETGWHYKANHLHTIFRKNCRGCLPGAEEFSSRTMSLPLHTNLSTEDQTRVVACLLSILRSHIGN